ncbi:Hypothetical_protein [Hexamita inflata]|uniref:Hypothetical_protein n=1 Tax=Hexamita inflata TaxID=28002 RepID=A0AA86NR26_9EUKA|nr:Hypothetical protein HINF_LOCUS10931 [Hexamita inflata]
MMIRFYSFTQELFNLTQKCMVLKSQSAQVILNAKKVLFMLQQVSETTFYLNRKYIFQHIAIASYLSFICFSSIELIFDHVSEVKIWSVVTKIKQILLDFQGSRKALLNHKIQLLQLTFLKHITVCLVKKKGNTDKNMFLLFYFIQQRRASRNSLQPSNSIHNTALIIAEILPKYLNQYFFLQLQTRIPNSIL